MTQRLAKLLGVPQTYAWGTQGSASLVAATHQASDSSFSPDPQTPYAELWFGSHPSGVSGVVENETRSDLLTWLGDTKFPYLFKVLSIAKPLSLQLHPDDENAARIHAEDPTHYKDPHSKPEMALALSDPFEAFCGFRKCRTIAMLIDSIPGFARLIKSMAPTTDESEFLRELLKTLYAASDELVESCTNEVLQMEVDAAMPAAQKEYRGFGTALSKLIGINKEEEPVEILRQTLRLFRRLHDFFPYDRGCFASFFLMYMRLRPGEAFYLGPNTIHAYISGNCLEVMKTSDNVIRAGLTEKFKDVERLLQLVNYKPISMSSTMIRPVDVSMKVEGGNSGLLKALVPLGTDAFRFYLLKLGTGVSVKDLKIPAWTPTLFFATHGTGEIRLIDTDRTEIITAGQCWISDNWTRISVKNVGQKTEAEDSKDKRIITLSADTLSDENVRNGPFEVVIVMPNHEAGRLKRSNKGLKHVGSIASPEIEWVIETPNVAASGDPPVPLSVEAFPQIAHSDADGDLTSDPEPLEPAPIVPKLEEEKKEVKKRRSISSTLRSLTSSRRGDKRSKSPRTEPRSSMHNPNSLEAEIQSAVAEPSSKAQCDQDVSSVKAETRRCESAQCDNRTVDDCLKVSNEKTPASEVEMSAAEVAKSESVPTSEEQGQTSNEPAVTTPTEAHTSTTDTAEEPSTKEVVHSAKDKAKEPITSAVGKTATPQVASASKRAAAPADSASGTKGRVAAAIAARETTKKSSVATSDTAKSPKSVSARLTPSKTMTPKSVKPDASLKRTASGGGGEKASRGEVFGGVTAPSTPEQVE